MRKQLRAARTNWEAIRDLKVKKARLKADVELRRLETEEHLLTARKTATEQEITSTGESEASLRARQVRGRRWGYLFVLAAGIAIASAWWSADWFLSLSWEKALLAVTIFVLPLIGWMTLLTFSKEILEHWDLRKIFAGMGLVIILSSTGAIAALGWARMLGVGVQEEQRQAQQFEVENDTAGPASTARRTRIEQTKRLLNGVAGLAVVFLAIAGEVAAGIAYHEWAKHRDIVGTVRPFFRRREVLADALARNEAAQEAVRKRPEILEAELTVKGLQAEAAAQSFSPAVRWIVGGFVALLALLIWLLWPEGKTPSGQAAGYPIEVVTTIYGFGENPNELLQTPLGVAFDNSGHVWISNTGQSRVEEYTTRSPSSPGSAKAIWPSR